MSLSPIRALTLEVPESIDLRQAARYLGAPGEPGSGTLALLERCAPPLLHAAMPKAVWRTADTAAWDEAGILQGADIRRHLTECPQAILLAVTLGPMVDSQIRRSAVGDVAAGAAARRWRSRWRTPPKASCGNGRQNRGFSSPGGSPPATATGPSAFSRCWLRRWTRRGRSGYM